MELALSRIPEEFRKKIQNLSIESREAPGPEARGMGKGLLGLYVGLTRQELLNPGEEAPLPGRILIYRRSLEALARDRAELQLEIERTLRHELAHYLGITDDRLEEIWPEGA